MVDFAVAAETSCIDAGAAKAEEMLSSEESSSESSSVSEPLDDSMNEVHQESKEDLCGGFRIFKRPSSLLVNVESSLSLTSGRTDQACLTRDNLSLDGRNNFFSANRGGQSRSNNPSYNGVTLSCYPTTTSNSNKPWSSLTSSASFSWLSSFSLADDDETAMYTADELKLDVSRATPATDLARPRSVWIVTTAALPWMTGTAVNPLLRAAYLYEHYCQVAANTATEEYEEEIFYESSEALTDDDDITIIEEGATSTVPAWNITLVIPWLEREEDRVELYGADWASKTCSDQEVYIRHWLREKANQPAAAEAIRIVWYSGRYYTTYRSIFPSEDVCDVLLRQVPPETVSTEDDGEKSVCILEEPEHLMLYRAMAVGTTPRAEKHPLSRSFYTLSVIHTNYRDYAAQGALGLLTKKVSEALCAVVTQAYTDKIIKLSGTLQSYAPHKETVCNVHGIRQDFLQVAPPTGDDIYFLGKLLWAKGLDKLLMYEKLYYRRTGQYFAIDIYGSGPDKDEIEKAFCTPRGRRGRTIPATFPGRLDHAAIPSRYKIFCNPSVTEVLCTVSQIDSRCPQNAGSSNSHS